jgi:polyhydroxyalkanoate synthesis repressor PhaR
VNSRGAPRTIKRYGNRKLYDPAARRYVTLAELAALVARGQQLVVLDQKSGEDLTNLTLAQALLEGIRQGASRLPRQVLTRLIRIAASPRGWGQWPEPEEAAGRARSEAERLVSGLLGRGRLSLDDAVALRQELGQLVHRLVSDAQSGVESRLRALFARGEEAAGRSLGALRGRIEAYIEPGAPRPAPRPRAAGTRPAAKRRRSSRPKRTRK